MSKSRLSSLRAELAGRGLDGFIIPQSDEHLSEFVGTHAQRLGWLTGFSGSAGIAVVTQDKAAVFVDGRYTEQLQREVACDDWRFETIPDTDPARWLRTDACAYARIGYDPWLHSVRAVRDMVDTLSGSAVTLVPLESNPIDAVWDDQPPRSNAAAMALPITLSGVSAEHKRREIAGALGECDTDATVICALDSIAWLFNIRGADIPYNPVALAFAVLWADASADLFIAQEKLTSAVIDHLGGDVRIQAPDAFGHFLAQLGTRTVAIDPGYTVSAITDLLAGAGATVVEADDPIVGRKARKNAAEIKGHKHAQREDGVALTRFLHWMSVHAPSGALDEIAAAKQLRFFREASPDLRDISFNSISAAGPNAACPHYMPTPATNRAILSGEVYLIDSGGQYLGGTTDVTRTIAVGDVPAQIRDRFTRVLKGHIGLATARFPAGTRGGQLDSFARRHLWEVGLDYNHGTGHGVGAFLSVHEGPARIGKPWPTMGGVDEVLAPGMILSNEPGYYKPDGYGIRIENLLLVVECDVPDSDYACLGFETLTFAPIDRSLIDVSLLTLEERQWVNAYHAQVAERIGPALPVDVREWLESATLPLEL